MGKIRGHLDLLRENLEVLDEAIATARKMSKPKGKGDKAAALQWTKTLRDLVEVRNTTLLNIKSHLLGRDETGTPNEPADVYDEDGSPQIEYERYFRSQLAPWTLQDLKLKCEDCGVETEDTTTRHFPREHSADEYFDLCDKCYEKRTAKDESEEESEASDPTPNLKESAQTQGEGSVDITMSEAVTGLVGNTIRAVTLEARSPLEMVKMLEDFKAKVSKTAGSQGSEQILEPGLALLDKEIERLQKEAELGKSQGTAGKPGT